MQTPSSSSPLHIPRKLLLGLLCALVAVAALADPSARVGRIAYLEGDVQFRAGEQADAAQASVNWPLTSGNHITTAPNARTEIRIGSSVIRLAGQSELLITALDDNRLALYLPYGSATVRVRNPELAGEFSLQTPQGQVSLLQPGRFRIDAGRDAPTTSLHVIDGAARFDTPQSAQGGQPALIVVAGGRLDSNNGFSQITSLRTAAANDGFDSWSLGRDRNDDRAQSIRYVSAETTGYEELDRNGVWRTTVDYGPVWTPTVVTADWAPYRDGRWLWVAPWGWTWVDNASWGYAPSHYGRWVSIDNRWCWAPGTVVARPVWAPAVVGWQGGVNFNHSSWAQRPPTTGWFPLAPREVYVPSYAVSRTYVERVNITHVTNVTQINNFYRGRADDRGHGENYRYRALASAVTPAAAMPAPSNPARGAALQSAGARQAIAPFMSVPGAAVAPISASTAALPTPAPLTGRHHPDGQRMDRPAEVMHQRAQASSQPLAAVPVPEHPHREHAGFSGHQGRSMQPVLVPGTAPAPAIPAAPVRAAVQMPPAPMAAAAPHPAPSHSEPHPDRGGRPHHEEQRSVQQPVPVPVAPRAPAHPPHPAAAPAAGPAAGPAPSPARAAHVEQRHPHDERGAHERNDGKERR